MAARVRRFLHFLLAELLYYSGSLAVWRFFRTRVCGRGHICVLGFHRVLSESEIPRSNSLPAIVMKESTFINLLEYVKQRFQVIGIEGIQQPSQNGSSPCCILTFDDGWKDNYTRAYPWIRDCGVPATIFLTTGLIGGEDTFWVERLIEAWRDPVSRQRLQLYAADRLATGEIVPGVDYIIEYFKRMPSAQRDQVLSPLLSDGSQTRRTDSADRMLSWDEVTEMSQGGIEFGAHTVTHPLLPYEDEATIEREVREAKVTLEEKLKKRVRAFAYPNGDWNPRARESVAAAGYECAFTTQQGWYQRGQDPYTIHRILLHEGNVTGRNGEFSPAMFALTLARSA
jgi:peptidoglycan/xylan/chitin deacetylase (PgdA/CDA1 family)